jgi:signal transduction histidine kinase
MSHSSESPRPSGPQEPSPGSGPPGPHQRPLLESGREQARLLLAALRTPSHPPVPLLQNASRRWVRLLPLVVLAVAATALVPVTVTVLTTGYGLNGGIAGALAVAQCVPLLLAVTRPLQAWWIVFAADVAGALVLAGAARTDEHVWPWPPMVIVGYLLLLACLGLRETRRTLVGVWLATVAAGLFMALLGGLRPALDDDGTWILLPVLGGVVLLLTGALRERGDAQRRLVEQEHISVAERSRRTLLEERTRIARELHDVVAHHMSVITVQADSAPYRIGGLPEEAREEFAAIAAGARESLTEMRRLLTVLRSDGAEGELAPQPGLSRLQQLVEATVRAGVPAELSLGADLLERAVPQAVDLSAYRIVQEALANVVRHAPGAVTRVSVTADGPELVVAVVNGPAGEPGSPPGPPVEGPGAGTGHGLVGMRERVRLTGGTLDTGPLPDGGFRVAARLPLGTPATAEEGA